jgi:hypothetical protein
MEDRWIPRASAQHPLGCKEANCPKFVSDFLLEGGGAWDEPKLREFFYEADVQDILKIHVGRAGMEDFIAWNHTKSGIFSVKSAYHLAVQRKSLGREVRNPLVHVTNTRGGLQCGGQMCQAR